MPAITDVGPRKSRSLASSIPRRRWRIALLLGVGVLVNFSDRVNLTVSHAALHAEFGITDVTFGYLSAAYFWTYGLCQLPVGVVLDRFGVRRVGRISTFLWSVASLLAAVSPSLGSFFAARLLLGIGEAPTFPANAKAVGKWFPPQERSFATSIFDSSAKLASAIGVPVIGVLLLRFGWRWSFAVTGVVSFLYFLLFFAVYRDPEDDPALTIEERNFIQHEATQAVASRLAAEPKFLRLLTHRKVIGAAIGFGAYNYTFYLLLTWLPSYLASELNIDMLHSFVYTGVPWIVATITDLCIGGILVDHLIQRGWNTNLVRRSVLIGGMVLGLGVLACARAHTPTTALVGITVSLAGLAAAAPVAWSLPSLISPAASVGTVGGIMNFSSQLSGLAAPIITGSVVFLTHSFAAAFYVAAAYLLIGIVAYVFLLGCIEIIDTSSPPLDLPSGAG